MNDHKQLFTKSKFIKVVQDSKISTIEDIKSLTDNNIWELISLIDKESLLHSMQAASPELRKRIFNVMNQRPSLMMQEDLDELAPLAINTLHSAQMSLLSACYRWELFGVFNDQ